MRDAVIVSTARSPIGKAYGGAFNDTQAQALVGHVVSHTVSRAGLKGAEVEDYIIGAALQQGATGGNIARQAMIRSGLPVTVASMSVDRQCTSGMMVIAVAAKQVLQDGIDIPVGAGVESVSLVLTNKMNLSRAANPWIKDHKPAKYMSMLETAETVANRYGISREAQDDYALQSQQRIAAAQAAGKFDDEIVPMTTVMKVMDRDTKEISDHEMTLAKDEGNRPLTSLEGLNSLQPVHKNGLVITEGNCITAGNASQLSDGASASVVMEGHSLGAKYVVSTMCVRGGMGAAGLFEVLS